MFPRNPWTKLRSDRRFEDTFFAIDEDTVINPAGRQTSYGVVRFKSRGLKILAIDHDGSTYLVQQFRYGAGYLSWELPAGGGEPGEDDETGARRELREEVGLTAAKWLPLQELVPSGSVTDQRDCLFLAWDLAKVSRNLDEQEEIRIRRLPFGEAVAMALAGQIGDSGSIVALLSVQLRATREDLPEDLVLLLCPPGSRL